MAYTTIDDGSAYFQTLLWTGDDNNDRALTNTGNSNLQPDWVWIKNRSGGAKSHQLVDSSRGVTKYLFSEATTVESTLTNRLDSFDTDGFTTDNHSSVNESSRTYVAWQWKANGGTTSSNSDGDITSTVQANTTAGFSIVTYTGNGNDGDTVGHGLSGNWDLCILKNRGQTDYWTVSRTGNNQVLLLHDNVNEANHSTAYMTKGSGVIGLVSAGDLGMVNGSSETYVAYVFKAIQGYSRFGSYTGNGNADGPFVYTGFKPAWLMIKATGSTGGASAWRIADNKRSSSGGGNPVEKQLEADTNNTEDSGNDVDLLSNGFKVRSTAAQWNASGVEIIYMAFAEHPFVSSEGVPTTAR